MIEQVERKGGWGWERGERKSGRGGVRRLKVKS